MDRYVYRRIWLSFRYLSSLRLSFEDTDQHLITMVHVTHTALFTSSIPLFGGYHTYFLAENFLTETYLANPKLVQPLLYLVESVNLPPELISSIQAVPRSM